MSTLREHIEALRNQIEALTANNAEEVEALRIRFLSKKGEITNLFNEFKTVSNEEKRELGQLLNQLKNNTQERINHLRDTFAGVQRQADKEDLTRTPEPIALGTRHPLMIVRNEIIDIFSHIGFTVAEGPEV
ncbi:MAG TPA: phenylalanine--tRNA ligase subunit alpha, partial [Bacteroidales bacterium]|nr:phenylalanine--tRNA ligase subunit alpha [Bacteroidales bacterium]